MQTWKGLINETCSQDCVQLFPSSGQAVRGYIVSSTGCCPVMTCGIKLSGEWFWKLTWGIKSGRKLDKRKILVKLFEQRTGRIFEEILMYDLMTEHFGDIAITEGRTKLIS